MRIMVSTKYLSEEGEVQFGRYVSDRSIAITVWGTCEFPEPLGTPTVCLKEYGLTPPENHVFIKDYSESVGWFECLIDQGIIELPDVPMTIPHGYGQSKLGRLTAKSIEEINGSGL